MSILYLCLNSKYSFMKVCQVDTLIIYQFLKSGIALLACLVHLLLKWAFRWEPFVFIFLDECMSYETWNRSINDTIACVEMIELYVINSVFQCDFLSSILYAFTLHDSWFRVIEIFFKWSYCMTIVSLLSSWHDMSRYLWVSSMESLTRHHSSTRSNLGV